MMRELTRMALAGKEGIAEQIDAMIAQAPEEVMESEEWQAIAGYLGFLKEFAAAEDWEGFLAGADEGMVRLMRQLSGEDAGDGDSSEEVGR